MCLRNDNRSPMAEAWVNHLYGDLFQATSAGLEPWPIDPRAVQVMEEVGIPISAHHPQRVFDLVVRDELFSYAVTLWDKGNYERRAYFPGYCIRLLWDIFDPSSGGSHEFQSLGQFRNVRDILKKRIDEWISLLDLEKKTTVPILSVHQPS